MSNGKAKRRHHRQRLMKKRAAYHGGTYASRPWKLVDTAMPCSCEMCGNARRYWGELTVQEKRVSQCEEL